MARIGVAGARGVTRHKKAGAAIGTPGISFLLNSISHHVTHTRVAS
jgi:hypothetical protein